MIIFPDTNYFLHYKDAAECPWRDLTHDDHVRLIVTRTVQREIDKKKHELTGRSHKRARKFASLVGKIVTSDHPLELREANPQVLLEVCLARPRDWEPPEELKNSASADDQLIADALAYREAHSEEQCVLLTADSGVVASAQRHGLSVFFLDDGWALPKERDARDKRITALEQELKSFRRDGPEIEILVSTPDETDFQAWEFECEEFRHHDKPERFQFHAVVHFGELPKNGGAIEIEVHARNLRQPVKRTIPVRIAVREEDTAAAAARSTFSSQ